MSTQKASMILVESVMLPCAEIPISKTTAFFKDILDKMNIFGLGIGCLTNDADELVGIITDGDIRRKVSNIQKPFSALLVDSAIQHAIKNPATVSPSSSLSDAVHLMETKKIWDLPVVSTDNKLLGLLHLHPAIKSLLKREELAC